MAISEAQFETWSRIGAAATSKVTYDTVKGVLEQAGVPYATRDYAVFLQGSYGNDTNVVRDSDVDVVICDNSIYYYDISELQGDAKTRFMANVGSTNWSAEAFKAQVITHLKAQFGQAVQPGTKAIYIPGGGNRRDADVLACTTFRRFHQYTNGGPQDYHQGVCFHLPSGERIVNYPKMHLANCTTKHQGTNEWFKPTVRTYKNMRNRMIERGLIAEGLAPSYFIEGMLYNVPNAQFGGSCSANFMDTLNWLSAADRSGFLCANERFYLFHPTSKVTWRAENCTTFLNSLAAFWRAGG
jgi:hypothetical protein